MARRCVKAENLSCKSKLGERCGHMVPLDEWDWR